MKSAGLVFVVVVILCQAGCSTNVSRFQMPGSDFGVLKTLYLQTRDNKHDMKVVAALIREDLRSRGYEVPGESDAVLSVDEGSYVVDIAADWHWDITWYLLELRVAIYDPADNTLIAQAQSRQTSLARTSTDDVVARTLAALFNER